MILRGAGGGWIFLPDDATLFQPATIKIRWFGDYMYKLLFGLLLIFALVSGCTQEQQNKISRVVQNYTGTNGVLEIYAGDKLVKRFIHIDKLSTAVSTSDDTPRPYRYGYGVLDANMNMVADQGEKKVYFEFSDYSTSYIFYGQQ